MGLSTNMFRCVLEYSPANLLPCFYLCANKVCLISYTSSLIIVNKIAPPHEGVELGVGESLLMKAIEGGILLLFIR